MTLDFHTNKEGEGKGGKVCFASTHEYWMMPRLPGGAVIWL